MASPCNKSFSSNYILLKPEEAGFLEVGSMLLSSDIGKWKFVDCPDGTREPFQRRWIIFISVLAMKLLQAVAKPLAALGSGIENWLNLLSANGGFFRLILNSIKGKVIHPDKTSARFISFIGNMDKRVKLGYGVEQADKRYYKQGNKRYYAVLSVMAAKASYENSKYIESVVGNHWEMDFLGFYDFWNDYQEKATTQAFILDDKKNTLVVAFRGTEPFDADAWSSDFDISWYELPELGKIHGGFLKALGLQKSQGWPQQQVDGRTETAYYGIRKLLKQHLEKNKKAKFIVTGHSLGGALAILFPAILALHEESELLKRLEGIYTYGQPRVGDEKFGDFMRGLIKRYNFDCFRFVYSFDMVPRLPYDDSTLMFRHFGTCIYYNSNYEGKVVAEEPDKNYFSVIWIIPKFVNACWELIRSFIIGYTRGPEYREGGLIRMFRFLGLLTAGVPAHCPPDYVNATRLGSSQVFLSLDAHKSRKLSDQ